jgi:hypothetical protein
MFWAQKGCSAKILNFKNGMEMIGDRDKGVKKIA